MLRLGVVWLEKTPSLRRPIMFKAKPMRHAGEGAAPVLGAGAGAARVTTLTEGEPIYTGSEMDVGYDEEGAEPEEAGHGPASHASSAADAAAAPIPPGGPEAPKDGNTSASAYHFLLNHIDAEIEALQRRHKEVTSRRKNEEEKQNTRVKELFKYMESPWLLLEPAVEPALPATGVDVYIKEVTLERRRSGKAEDKMFVLACHKNYHNMPFAEKKHYEAAARYNGNLRQQMKQHLSTGLTRFETFCSQMKEGTAEMSKQGQLSDVPSASLPARPWLRHRSQKKEAAHKEEPAEEEEEEAAAEDEEDDDAEETKPSRGRGAKRKTVVKPAKRAVKRKAQPKPSKARGRKPQAKKSQKAAKRTPKPKATAGRRKAAADSGRAAPKSIPLPRIDLSALKRRKNVLTKSHMPKKKAAAKASKKKPKRK